MQNEFMKVNAYLHSASIESVGKAKLCESMKVRE